MSIERLDDYYLFRKVKLVNEIKELFARGMNVHSRCHTFNKSLLHYAALEGKLDVVKFLLENGAEIDSADFDG